MTNEQQQQRGDDSILLVHTRGETRSIDDDEADGDLFENDNVDDFEVEEHDSGINPIEDDDNDEEEVQVVPRCSKNPFCSRENRHRGRCKVSGCCTPGRYECSVGRLVNDLQLLAGRLCALHVGGQHAPSTHGSAVDVKLAQNPPLTQ